MARRFLYSWSLVLGAGLAGAVPGCGQTNTSIPVVSFDEARAFRDLEHLVTKIGSRRIGTPESAATRQYVRQQLEPLGWAIEEDRFPVTVPAGAARSGPIEGANLIARRAGTVPGEIWIASHYDTLDMPGFVGANDAGSSSAVLIELGRQLAGSGARTGMSVVLCWLDGEEKFPPLDWHDHTNSTFGSRHLVERLKAAGELQRVEAFLLLDMVGDKDLVLVRESQSSGWLRDVFERTAHALGYKQLFGNSEEIKDDHMHFVRAGVPSIDLIDFTFGPATRPGGAWWHTKEDTLDKCSAQSLGIVGRLVLSALPEVERLAAAR